ncbi:hypothetical protein J40TS1_32130 [Paenibacillus montaniterrae]|uniref:Uncharacterized protein n=1 Tax=Paenibacillus montaniterrae TaxID=429341 RepID=A0A920CY49_9BACL|nr:hypothetical protein J40TS1_32130 [Paenibacillus montaniterrae]
MKTKMFWIYNITFATSTGVIFGVKPWIFFEGFTIEHIILPLCISHVIASFIGYKKYVRDK